MQLDDKNDTSPNKTAKDAYRRMDSARWGSLGDTALPYLYTLQSEIKDWLRCIEFEIKHQEEK